MDGPKSIPASAADVRTVAATIYGEARGSTHDDRIAVAWVIRNRAETARAFRERTRRPHPLFGDGSLASACLAVEGARWKQFSCWNAGDPNRPRVEALRDPVGVGDRLADPVYRRSLAAALAVIEGLAADPTDGSTHYHTVAMGWPRTWGERRTPACVIGAHAFYNDVD